MARDLTQSRDIIKSDKANFLLNAILHCFRRAASRLLSLPVTAPALSARALAPRVPLPVLSPLKSQLALHTRWFSDNTASRDPTSSPEDENHDVSDISAESDVRDAQRLRSKKRSRIMAEPPAPKETVYVGNLFYDVTAEDLKNHMQKFGVVERVDLITDNRGMSRGFAYVHFDSIDAARRCVEAMHLQNYEGRRVSAQYASSGGGTRPLQPVSKTLYLGNLSFEMTDRDLNELFKDIDNVIDVRVSVDRRTGQPRGFAHAEFLDVESAQKAFEILSAKAPFGRRIRVDYSNTNRRGTRIEEVPDEH
ncbi:31 kDa ribonucleoprotein, chloroplastic [Aspergillus udagawae]|uniref:31 kDa ribonucleoprotein, chloroplastic n=1 Tax=Aspergillus udagawae TaxID=91492 RepID=A0A8H3NRY8_9EURO|nr:31 kDa ribonucleoprotein, chloroplastic [Aspergillus udagawae]